MKLSEFKSTQKKEEKQEKINNEPQKKSTEDVEKLFDKYKDIDSNSLMQELIKNVDKQKSDGSFDFEKLQSQISQVLPYLSTDQQKYLMTILSQLK